LIQFWPKTIAWLLLVTLASLALMGQAMHGLPGFCHHRPHLFVSAETTGTVPSNGCCHSGCCTFGSESRSPDAEKHRRLFGEEARILTEQLVWHGHHECFICKLLSTISTGLSVASNPVQFEHHSSVQVLSWIFVESSFDPIFQSRAPPFRC